MTSVSSTPNSGGAGEQVEQVLEDQDAVESPQLKDQGVRIEPLIEFGVEDNASAAMVASDWLLTGTALPPLPDAPPMTRPP